MSKVIGTCGFGGNLQSFYTNGNLDSFYKNGSGDIMYYRPSVLECLDTVYSTEYKNYKQQSSSTHCSSSSSFGTKTIKKKLHGLKLITKYLIKL